MSRDVSELYCLLIPLSGWRLLVPRSCVAEVVGLGRLRIKDTGPEWLLGEVGWADRVAPLVAFETACGENRPELGRRARAVVLHGLGEERHHDAVAVLSQGLPQLVRVNPAVLAPDHSEDRPPGPVLCRVRMVNERPVIPDLERLDSMLVGAG